MGFFDDYLAPLLNKIKGAAYGDPNANPAQDLTQDIPDIAGATSSPLELSRRFSSLLEPLDRFNVEQSAATGQGFKEGVRPPAPADDYVPSSYAGQLLQKGGQELAQGAVSPSMLALIGQGVIAPETLPLTIGAMEPSMVENAGTAIGSSIDNPTPQNVAHAGIASAFAGLPFLFKEGDVKGPVPDKFWTKHDSGTGLDYYTSQPELPPPSQRPNIDDFHVNTEDIQTGPNPRPKFGPKKGPVGFFGNLTKVKSPVPDLTDVEPYTSELDFKDPVGFEIQDENQKPLDSDFVASARINPNLEVNEFGNPESIILDRDKTLKILEPFHKSDAGQKLTHFMGRVVSDIQDAVEKSGALTRSQIDRMKATSYGLGYKPDSFGFTQHNRLTNKVSTYLNPLDIVSEMAVDYNKLNVGKSTSDFAPITSIYHGQDVNGKYGGPNYLRDVWSNSKAMMRDYYHRLIATTLHEMVHAADKDASHSEVSTHQKFIALRHAIEAAIKPEHYEAWIKHAEETGLDKTFEDARDAYHAATGDRPDSLDSLLTETGERSGNTEDVGSTRKGIFDEGEREPTERELEDTLREDYGKNRTRAEDRIQNSKRISSDARKEMLEDNETIKKLLDQQKDLPEGHPDRLPDEQILRAHEILDQNEKMLADHEEASIEKPIEPDLELTDETPQKQDLIFTEDELKPTTDVSDTKDANHPRKWGGKYITEEDFRNRIRLKQKEREANKPPISEAAPKESTRSKPKQEIVDDESDSTPEYESSAEKTDEFNIKWGKRWVTRDTAIDLFKKQEADAIPKREAKSEALRQLTQDDNVPSKTEVSTVDKLTNAQLEEQINSEKSAARLKKFEERQKAREEKAAQRKQTFEERKAARIKNKAEQEKIRLIDKVTKAQEAEEIKARLAKGKDKPETSLLTQVGLLLKTLKSSYDVSAPLRQGAIMIMDSPAKAPKALYEMVKSLVSENNYKAFEDSLIGRENYQNGVYKEAGLSLTEFDPDAPIAQREEAFAGSLADKIPGVRGSGRAYNAFLNSMRADVFDSMLKDSIDAGDADTPELRKGIASAVNTMSGRGDLGSLQKYAAAGNAVLYSPRFIKSRLDLMNPSYYAKLPKTARMRVLKSVVKLAGANAALIGLNAATGGKVETDPTKSDFGKIVRGNTRADFSAGLLPYVKFVPQVIGTYLSMKEKQDSGGKLSPFDKTPADVIAHFLRSKLAPHMQAAADITTGKTFVGQNTDTMQILNDLASPMVIQDIIDSYKTDPDNFAWAVPASLLGASVSIYDNTKNPDGTDKKAKKSKFQLQF